MQLIDTASRHSKLLKTRTVKLQVLCIDRLEVNLIFYNVIYLPACPVNLYAVSKMIKKKEGYLKLNKLIRVTPASYKFELCAVDNNLFLIEALKLATTA